MNFNYPVYPFSESVGDTQNRWPSNPSGLFLVYPADDGVQVPFLEKILNAVGVKREQAAHWVVEGSEILPMPLVLRESLSNKVIVFGVPLSQACANVNTQKYQLFEMQGRQWIWADSLAAISQDNGLKQSLWLALRTMFGV